MDNFHRKEYMLPEMEKTLENIRKNGYKENKNSEFFLIRFFKWIGRGIYNFIVNIHFFFDVRKV